MMTFRLKKFSELNSSELYELLKLRSEVFVVEQKCAYQDLDGKDHDSLHLLGYESKDLVAYARLVKPGISYKEASIGRVVVSPGRRKKKYGYTLMEKALRDCEVHFSAEQIVISAQRYLEKFYNNLGFVTESEPYLEDDIPHVKMRYMRK
jgi:ElaA protein